MVPGEIAVIRPNKWWNYAGHSYLSGEIVSVRLEGSVLDLVPLKLKKRGTWDMYKKFTILITLLHLTACSTIAIKSGEGPFDANGQCPTFKPLYPKCEVIFGNRGLSVLNSFYETFVGEGAFEIYEFATRKDKNGALIIAAKSNRGELKSEIIPDRIVRIGQDRENEKLYRTHQSSYCHNNRIHEHQVVYDGGDADVQDLNFWEEQGIFHFTLYQNGSKTALVRCQQ